LPLGVSGICLENKKVVVRKTKLPRVTDDIKLFKYVIAFIKRKYPTKFVHEDCDHLRNSNTGFCYKCDKYIILN
jgi:hypothetical protein